MKYFTELKLSGYKSIKDVTLKLNPGINILIGPNGSGKSNLLEFISYLKDEVPEIDKEFSVEISWKVDKNKFHKKISQEFVSKNLGARPTPLFNRKLEDFISKLISYSLYQSKRLVVEFEKSESVSNEGVKGKIGELSENLINQITYVKFQDNFSGDFLSVPKSIHADMNEVLHAINNNSPFSTTVGVAFLTLNLAELERFDIRDRFKVSFTIAMMMYITELKLYTAISDIRLNDIVKTEVRNEAIFAIENIQLQFKIENSWHNWDELSDGTRRIITIIYYVITTQEVVLLEEPELGIHPHQLTRLLDFLKEQSKQKQIILSTHSPDVLDALNLDQLDSMNIVSNKKGSTKVRKLTANQKKKAFDYYEEFGTIGDYWKHSDLEV